jgi:hypothetical protein
MQPGDIAGERIVAHDRQHLEDSSAVALGDALKLFCG